MLNKLRVGPHISIAKGYEKACKEAIKITANTFQFFTRNPRGGKAKALDFVDINKAKELMKENNIKMLLAHAPYTLNLASKNKSTAEHGIEMFIDDLERLKTIPAVYYNFHPGSHTGLGVEKGINQIVSALNKIIDPSIQTTILLETMSGKGTEIGRNFEEINAIIEGVKHNDKLGVCLDTCHVFSAGYDIVNDLDGVLEEFDKLIGLDRLKAIHLNDSLKPFAANKDRHAKIGEGLIGEEAIINIINHPKLSELPFYLETPNEAKGYKREIKLLNNNYKKI